MAVVMLSVYPILYLTGLSPFKNLDTDTVLITIGVPVLVFAFGGIRMQRNLRKQQQRVLDGYELFLTEDAIAWKQDNAPEVKIQRDEISAISEFASGRIGEGLIIRSANSRKYIKVPLVLEGYEEVHSALANWKEIQPGSFKKGLLFSIIFAAVYGGTFILMITSHDFLVAASTGAVLILVLFWSVVEVRQQSSNRNLGGWRLWFSIVAIVVIVAAKLYSLLSSQPSR